MITVAKTPVSSIVLKALEHVELNRFVNPETLESPLRNSRAKGALIGGPSWITTKRKKNHLGAIRNCT